MRIRGGAALGRACARQCPIQAVVLTLEPRALRELAPLFCRSCTKLVRKDCRAAVDWLEPAAEVLVALLSVVPAVLLALELLLVVEVLPVLELLSAPVALPPKSAMSFWNAVLRFDSVLDDRPEDESVLLSSWLLARSATSVLSAAMMPPWP